MSNGKKYEFRVEAGRPDIDDLELALKTLSADGWEVVGITTRQDTDAALGLCVLLKREIPKAEKPMGKLERAFKGKR